MPSSGQEYFWRRKGLAYVPDVTQQRNIRGKPGELNLSTLTYLIPFQGEQKSSKQSRRIIEVARDSLLKTKSCFPGRLRAIFWEYRESKDTHKKSNFFLFCQNIPLGKLIQETIIQSSNELFNRRKFKKFEKCIKWRF